MVHNHANLLNKTLETAIKNGESIGFVPTMGALHVGHISLVNRSLKENDHTVVSIFVNPTQFDNDGDLKKYPRTLDEDAKLLKKADPSILIFAPQAKDLYSNKVRSKKYRFSGLEHEMEGKHRKGHFDGVGTVLDLLFRTVKPTRAYFGKKDYQQFQIVRKLVQIEKLPVEIVGCEIVREPNGLAMSSRNKRLTKTQLEEAALIHRTLQSVKEKFASTSISELNKFVQQQFSENPHLELEYFEIANIKNLKTAVRKRKGNRYRGFIAAFAGEVRLIDNMSLN